MFKKLTTALTPLLCLCAAARAEDHPCATTGDFIEALAEAVGGDTITLQAGNTFVGPFTLRSGLTSTVTIRSSAHALLPPNDTRVTNADRVNMPIIHCGNIGNDLCFSTSGPDADNWRLTGLEIRTKPGVPAAQLIQTGSHSDTVAADTPNTIEIDHCYIHAPEAGIVRGIFLGGRNVNVHDNHIAGFRKNGQECQAILLHAAPGPVTIRNNYLSAAGEVVMSGGVPVAAATMPANLTFTRNYLEVPQRYNPFAPSTFDEADAPWSTPLTCSLSSTGTSVNCPAHGLAVDSPANGTNFFVIKLTSGPQAGQKRTVYGVPTADTMNLTEPFSASQSGASATVYGFWPHKNNFELKMLAGTNNLIEGNVFDGAWLAGQNGFALVFTIHAQGAAGSPHAVIQNVTVRRNYIKRAYSGVQFLTSGYNFPTDHIRNFTLSDNVFEGLGSSAYGPPGYVRADALQISNGGAHGADGLTIAHNTFSHAQTTPQWGATLMFIGDHSTPALRHDNFVLRDNLISFETNGIWAEGGLVGSAALDAATDDPYTFTNNALYRAISTAPAGYPTAGNWYETSSAPLGWADPSNSNYTLTSGPYRAGQPRQASDNKDVGADIAAVTSAIGASGNAYGTATIRAVSGVWADRTNLALGKAATQSSTAFGGAAGRGADGDTNGDWYANSVTHTNSEAEAWWHVDLGSVQQIQTVDVWNRSDCYSHFLTGFYVFVSNEPIPAGVSAALADSRVSSYHTTGQAGRPTSLAVNRAGRYVRVQLAGTNYLSLAEVQVWGGAPVNNSLSVSGAGLFRVAHSSLLNLTGPFTIEAWIKPNAATTMQQVISRPTSTGQYYLTANQGWPQIYVINSSGQSDFAIGTPPTIVGGQWQHLAGVFDGTQLRIYHNGVLRATKVTTIGAGAGTGELTLGGYPTGDWAMFSGLIDEVRISAAVLYTSNFTPQAHLQALPSTRALWKFDGQSLADSSGNGHNGTLWGDAGFSPDAPAGN